jgi:hypothetical protein
MVATRHVTVEEFAAMPLEGRWELVDQELIELSWSGARDASAGGHIFIALKQHAEPKGIG